LPVMVTSSGGLQINARPYFPIIAWDVWKSAFNNQSFDKAFRDLKNIGFNAACTPIASRGEDYDGFLRAADGNGVQLIVSGDGGPNSEDSERLLKDVANAQGHSSILGWYLAEQPSQRIAPWQLKSQAHTVREIDPMHLTFRSELASGDSLPGAEFAGTTEGLFPFIFPLRENSSRIPEVISILQAARKQEPKGVVIPVLQCFKGQGYPAYPTLQELRAMVWLCAIHGANGIGFFTYNTSGELQGMTAEPDVWKNVCRVVNELSRLQGVLTAVAVPQPPPPKILKGAELDLMGHPSISYLYKEIGNRRLLFCVNSTREPVEARFTLRDADQATVLFESRTINLVKDRLSDHFQPLAVHIYEVHRMFE